MKITDEKSYASRLVNPKFTGIPEHQILKPDVIRAGGILHDLITPKIHEFHDTRYRRIEYWLEATTKFREYMPASVLTTIEDGKTVPTDEQIKVLGERVTTWIPSSAPPAARRCCTSSRPSVGCAPRTEGTRELAPRVGAACLPRPPLARFRLRRDAGGRPSAGVLPGRPRPDREPAAAGVQERRHAVGKRPDLGEPVRERRGAAARRLPARPDGSRSPGAWLPAFAPKTESDQPPGPFPVRSRRFRGWAPVEVAPHDVHYDEERRLWYCDIEVVDGRVVLPVHSAGARPVPAELGPRGAPLERRARRLHAPRSGPVAHRLAGPGRRDAQRQCLRLELQRLCRTRKRPHMLRP